MADRIQVYKRVDGGSGGGDGSSHPDGPVTTGGVGIQPDVARFNCY